MSKYLNEAGVTRLLSKIKSYFAPVDKVTELENRVASIEESGGGAGGTDGVTIVQTKGDSKNAVMSQKAVTEAIDGIKIPVPLTNEEIYTITSDDPNNIVFYINLDDTELYTCVAKIGQTFLEWYNDESLPTDGKRVFATMSLDEIRTIASGFLYDSGRNVIVGSTVIIDGETYETP